MSSGLVYPNPSPWPPGELDVEIKSKSRRGVGWGGGLASNATLEPRGRGRHSELLSFGNSGPFGVLLKEHPREVALTAG